jgi:hypothetical protein
MKSALLSLLITAAAVLGLSPASAQTNMVKNGDFSLPYDYWANHHFDYHGGRPRTSSANKPALGAKRRPFKA